jgi:antitoxin component of MazEF toxin-antitoxin module
MLSLEKKTVRLHNSQALLLPAVWTQFVGLQPGDVVIVELGEDRLTVKKKEASDGV